jgi:hypothetical protein
MHGINNMCSLRYSLRYSFNIHVISHLSTSVTYALSICKLLNTRVQYPHVKTKNSSYGRCVAVTQPDILTTGLLASEIQ